jgi:hypothetical protein
MSTVSGTSSAAGITRIGVHSEYHHPQQYANLRRSQPRSVQAGHGVAHVLNKLMQ